MVSVMANNRMWLVHVPTGRRVLLAKRFGGDWEVWEGGKQGSIAGALDRALKDSTDTSWTLEFEHDEPERGSTICPTCYQAFWDKEVRGES